MANETTKVAEVAADIVQDVATGQQQMQANLEMSDAPVSDTNPVPVKVMSGGTGGNLAATIPASANSVTAAASALMSSLVTINASLRAITLIPRSGKTIYLALGGAASASTPAVPPGGISLTITKAVADTLYVYSADGGPNLDVIQHI